MSRTLPRACGWSPFNCVLSRGASNDTDTILERKRHLTGTSARWQPYATDRQDCTRALIYCGVGKTVTPRDCRGVVAENENSVRTNGASGVCPAVLAPARR